MYAVASFVMPVLALVFCRDTSYLLVSDAMLQKSNQSVDCFKEYNNHSCSFNACSCIFNYVVTAVNTDPKISHRDTKNLLFHYCRLKMSLQGRSQQIRLTPRSPLVRGDVPLIQSKTLL